MARPKKSIPSYSFHKASGQAVVYHDGKTHYLGPHDSPESRKAYSEFLSRLAADTLPAEATSAARKSISVSELCLRFALDELPRFSRAEQLCQLAAIRILRELLGETPVDEFGPLRLRLVRQAMVEGNATRRNAKGEAKPRKPWSRETVNRMVKRLQSLFRWGVSWQMVPDNVASSLGTLRILVPGETAAAEATPRRPVAQEDIDAVAAKLKPVYRDILALLCLTGARPGELVSLRMRDLDRSGDVWRAELKRHKTAHKGKRRVLYFNREAQAVLLRYVSADPDALLLPVRRDNFGHAVRVACKRAKVTPGRHEARGRRRARSRAAGPGAQHGRDDPALQQGRRAAGRGSGQAARLIRCAHAG